MKKVDVEKKEIFGLLGRHLRHSFSPLMHNGFFRAEKMACEYFLFEIEPENVKAAAAGLRALGIKGANVTFPYKEKIMPFLDDIHPAARAIGAVNTLKLEKGRLRGYNTDGEGFIRSLKEKGLLRLRGKRCLLIGAGGAAKAVSVSLLREKAAFLGIYDLDKQKAQSLCRRLRRLFPGAEVRRLKGWGQEVLGPLDLIVNATPAGMRPADALPLPLSFISRGMLVYDLVYNPLETKLLQAARARGARTMSGLWMLVYQGLRSLEIWLGRSLKGKEKILYRSIFRYVKP